MTRIVLKRERARDPMAVAQEIITDLRFENARLTRMVGSFTRTAVVAYPKPHTWFDNLMAKNLGCLIARHHWVQIRPDVDSFEREICSYCSKIKIGLYNQSEGEDDMDDFPTGGSAPTGPGLGHPIGGPVRRRGPASHPEHAPNGPAPASPIPGNPDDYDEDGDLVAGGAVVSPPVPPPTRVVTEGRRPLSWSRIASRLAGGPSTYGEQGPGSYG